MGINTFNIATPGAVVAALTAKQRSLSADGTPKLLQSGIARACYAIISNNTSSVIGGAVFFDKYLQPVAASTYTYSFGSQNPMVSQYSNNGDMQSQAQLFYNTAGTQTNPGSGATATYLNGTNTAGEFGAAMVDVYSNGTMSPQRNRSNDWTVKHLLNQMFVDSDHADKSIVYILYNGILQAAARIDGDYQFNYYNTLPFTISGLDGNMYGSASYNTVRKELVVFSYASTTTGVFNVIIFKGLDLDKYPSPAAAFADPGVVRVTTKSVTLPNFPVSGPETIYSTKPTLCDSGDIFVTTMHPNNYFALNKVVRDASDNLTASAITAKNVTTTYGREQGVGYGQRRMQTRDGGAVMCFCAYYYYGSGMVSFVIDKRRSTWFNTAMLESADTAIGYKPVPYGDSGFASYYAANYYSSNSSGAYITGAIERNGAGQLFQNGSNIYLALAPGPNTTNYPGLTQVTDYSMLNNQALV